MIFTLNVVFFGGGRAGGGRHSKGTKKMTVQCLPGWDIFGLRVFVEVGAMFLVIVVVVVDSRFG